MAVDIFLNYITSSSLITIFVLSWLSFYFVLAFSILFSRHYGLSYWASKEKYSLEALMMGSKIPRDDSILRKCTSSKGYTAELLSVCKNVAEKNATSGLVWLSIIASTSPFIGLFGTVVSILDTFSGLGQNSSASLGIIAPAISEALVATAAGIFVAIPAYSFHLIIKRKAYEVINLIDRQSSILIANMANEQQKAKDNDELGRKP